MGQYLDLDGLKKYNDRVKGYIDEKIIETKSDLTSIINSTEKEIQQAQNNLFQGNPIGNISYSFEEQNLGIVWTTGKQLKQRTFRIPESSGYITGPYDDPQSYNLQVNGKPNEIQLVNCQGFMIDNAGITHIIPYSYTKNGKIYSAKIEADIDKAKLIIQQGQENCRYWITIVYYYKSNSSSNFIYVPRLTKPSKSDPQAKKYYFSNTNIYYAAVPESAGWNDFLGMPNCTAYAYGRFREAFPQVTKEEMGDIFDHTYSASSWINHTSLEINYQKPILGAIACWDPGLGHVGIVEEIKDDDTIVVSESYAPKNYAESLDNQRFFHTYTRTRSNGWAEGLPGYTLQGFLYPPEQFRQN